MARIFVYDGRDFPDPDPTGQLPVEQVRLQMAEHFPELYNADTKEEKRGEDMAYIFAKRIGTKGAAVTVPSEATAAPNDETGYAQGFHATIVGILRAVPPKRLAIFVLARELLDERGDLKLEEAARHQPEINLATVEAESYTRATQAAIRALRGIRAR